MKALRILSCLTLVASPLMAQTPLSNESQKTRELSTWKFQQAVDSATNYCGAVDEFSLAHQARLFAESRSERAGPSKWVELFSRQGWERAGRPRPLAFAWYRGDRVVRVTISFNGGPDASLAYATYCYSPEGRLIRVQSGPSAKVSCDPAHFQCHLIFGVTSFFSSNGRLIAKLLLGSDPSALKSERATFDWVEMMPPLYFTIKDLPFDAELRKLTKTGAAPVAASLGSTPGLSAYR